MADTSTTDFLRSFLFDGGLLQLTVGDPADGNVRWLRAAPRFSSVPEDADVYFGPALRAREGSLKRDVQGSLYLWLDIDDPVVPDFTFPPSALVFSGNGNHGYWRLTEPLLDLEKLEQLNKILIADVPTADPACWNSNRLLRVPGTWNVHRPDKPPRLAELRTFESHTYSVEDIEVLGRLDERVRHVIRTGDSDAWKSRSERDWFVIMSLLTAGASDELVTFLFHNQPVGDKYREGEKGEHYLQHTLAAARQQLIDSPPTVGELPESKAKKERRKGANSVPVQIVEKSDGYYMVGHVSRRISTFTLDPKVLLQGVQFGAPDAIVCDVQAGDDVWEGITFSREAFNSIAAMDKACPVASWSWLGTDSDVRQLLPFLMDRLREKEFPHVAASPVVGLHWVGGELCYLGDKEVLTTEGAWIGTSGPLTWLPTQREHPKQSLNHELADGEIALINELLPRLNEPCPLWTMIGWHTAATLKPWLESQGVRFPILNITGTRGSGKTTLNKLLMALFSGQPDPNVYDAGTTRFVRLALLGSSNAVPIAFGEFRYESVEQFIRTVLLSYDTGHDPRGRADQTTQDFALSAPYSIDGEDVIQDPAARERILIARLRPETVDEGTVAYKSFGLLRHRVPAGLAAHICRSSLALVSDGTAIELLAEAKADMFAEYPGKLPDRVRNNYTVAHLGVKLYARAMGVEAPTAAVFRPGLEELVNMASGRSRTLVDEFVEAIVNYAAQHGHVAFNWKYEPATKRLWFQMSSAHGWWLMQRRRQNMGTLQRDAIVAQLREAPYMLPANSTYGTIMYGVDLAAAQRYGLDIPPDLGNRQITLELN